jgi:hypothetical protein
MKAFRCARTGVLYPEDYVENWGRVHGIGLGDKPISEALINDYYSPVVGEGEKAMHPIGSCRAQVDLVEVTEEEFDKNKAILHADDTDYRKRAEVMKSRQRVKSAKMREIAISINAEIPLK